MAVKTEIMLSRHSYFQEREPDNPSTQQVKGKRKISSRSDASCTATAGGLGPAVPWAAAIDGSELSVCLGGNVAAAVGTPITDDGYGI